MKPRTLYDKIWDDHLVDEQPDGTCLLYIDRHLVHEVTSPQAFEGLRNSGRKVRAPHKTLAVVDHNVPTTDRKLPNPDPESAEQIKVLAENARHFGFYPYLPEGWHWEYNPPGLVRQVARLRTGLGRGLDPGLIAGLMRPPARIPIARPGRGRGARPAAL